ncbi:MAG: hypothetical protein O3C43_18500 [Verrucomicrobia bacterium]|nr:hypothetical protein [Verrucomicrobiota bacterium]MDA1068481.1 hypothetical protein [Verrucomicrobiota bacterium]
MDLLFPTMVRVRHKPLSLQITFSFYLIALGFTLCHTVYADDAASEIVAITYGSNAPGTEQPFVNVSVPVISNDGTVGYLG